MNRQEFLSILGATPFAIKAFATDIKKEPANPTFKDKTKQHCVIKDERGKEIALLSDVDLNINFITDENVVNGWVNHRVLGRKWYIDFEDAMLATDNRGRLLDAMFTRETLISEVYMPYDSNNEMLLTGYCEITDLEITRDIASGTIKGIQELVKSNQLP